jgi:hypothetical protein
MDKIYVSLLNIVSQEVVPHFYMFGSGVKHEIFGNTGDTRAITHEREPIMLQYSFWSTNTPSSSASSDVVILIGVDRGFESSILKFLRMSFVYLA